MKISKMKKVAMIHIKAGYDNEEFSKCAEGNSHFYMFTTMIFREEISISRAFWSGKNHFCLVQPVQKSFPISPEILFQECLFTFCM